MTYKKDLNKEIRETYLTELEFVNEDLETRHGEWDIDVGKREAVCSRCGMKLTRTNKMWWRIKEDKVKRQFMPDFPKCSEYLMINALDDEVF